MNLVGGIPPVLNGNANGMYGRKHSDKAKRAIGIATMNRPNAFVGKTHSEKAKTAMRRQRKQSVKFREAAKKRDNVVYYRVYDVDGNNLGLYYISEFARLMNFYAENARKQIKKTGKYKQWKFVEEERYNERLYSGPATSNEGCASA